MKTRLPKQIYILIAAAILLGILLRQVNDQTPEVETVLLDVALIEGIPSIPNLSGWPKALFAELKEVHEAFNDPDQRVDALARLGEIYFANGFYGEALQCFSALMQIEPNNPRWPYFMGVANRDYQDKAVAIESFERALELEGAYDNIRYELGMAFVESGSILDSIVHFEILMEKASWAAWAHYGLAKGLYLEERYEQADQELRKAINLDPDVREFYALVEELWYYEGDFVKAKEAGAKKEQLPYEKKPYDPWIQSLWESCFDTFRLVRLAEAEALAGNRDAGIEILAKARLIPGSIESHGNEIESIDDLLRKLKFRR